MIDAQSLQRENYTSQNLKEIFMPLQLSGNWTRETINKSINQVPTPPTLLGDNFFKNKKGLMSSDFKIPILRGDAVIKEITASGSARNNEESHQEKILKASCHRFTDSRNILVKDLQQMTQITDQSVRVKSEAQLILDLQTQAKNAFTATAEFLRIGAVVGTVLDVKNNKLFEFKNNITAFEFKVNSPLEKFQAIEDALLE